MPGEGRRESALRLMRLGRRAEVIRSPCAYAVSMSAIYAWLRRHQIFVDSVLAGVVALLGVGQMLVAPWPQVPITALLTGAVVMRRRAPATAFAVAALAGLWQLV